MNANSYSYSERKGYLPIDWDCFHKIVNGIVLSLKEKPDVIIGISRGGLYPATFLSHILQIELIPIQLSRRVNDVITYATPKWVIKPSEEDIRNKKVLIVDEICDSGETLEMVKDFVKSLNPNDIKTAVLYSHKKSSNIPDYIGKITDELVLNPWDRVVLNSTRLEPNKEYLEALKQQGFKEEDFIYSVESIVPDKG